MEANDDGFLARCADTCGGAFAEGDTIEEAIFNCVDVIKMIGDYRTEHGESPGLNTAHFSPDMRISVALPVEFA
jgi:predicted RNase H-like HicB family nuclease